MSPGTNPPNNRHTGLALWLFAATLVILLFYSKVFAGEQALTYVEQVVTVDGTAQTVQIPQGYVLEVLSDELGSPRLLSFGPAGELLIGSQSGFVYRLTPPYREPEILVRMSGYPHSVLVRGGELLIARTNGVYVVDYDSATALARQRARLLAPLPGGFGHTSRSIALGPDGRLYASLGIRGNCSDEYIGDSYPFTKQRGGVLVLDESVDPPVWQPFATGLRNPVGFDWHPHTGVMYASNNGPDHLGFDQPPEHFAALTAGSFHGMPWFYFDGQRVHRDGCVDSDPPQPIERVTTPVATFPARSAPMGVAFVPDGALEPDLVGDALVAVHGSWGTAPSGGAWGDSSTRRHPKVVAVRFERGTAVRVDDLITGFQLEDGSRWARPVGIAVGPDGAVYFTSDDGAEALFRLRRDVSD